ncbi:MAG: phosphoribosylanthranilate isomerase [Sphaerochaeta sp.]|nr:phosphoribosylanthranilate isomerase [Sphaerochaeta sp.]MDD3930041.1 phosphoribosylanthranilate isomerase [Sphaerochaeta sp.]
MTRIKLCGLSKREHVLWANEVLPDFIGFVFATSKRRVTMEQALSLRALVDPRIQVVGVFVDEPQERILSLVAQQGIDLIQLHGEESADYIRTLRMRTRLPIIKALRNPSPHDFESPEALSSDYLLLDARQPGSGQSFDWSVTKACTKPFFLAGGLTPENLAQAITTCKPFAVDLSSGVERLGQKDRLRMHQAVACAHRW